MPCPAAIVRSWSWHSPPSSQIGQSCGWFIISHSSTYLRSWIDWGSRVVTSMPSWASVMQAITMRALPCIVTVTAQTRHEPTAPSALW